MLLSGHSSAPPGSSPQPLDSTRSVRAEPPRSGSISGRGSPPAASSTGQQCAGSMAKWIKEHLGFKSSKPPPPAPPKPDYRQCQAGGHHHHHHHSAVPQFPVTPAGQPDILAAYKLQKERDFEDPYTTSSATGSSAPMNSSIVPTAPPAPTAQSPSSPSPEVKYVSPKHRLIKVDTGEKGGSSPTNSSNPTSSSSSSGGTSLKSPPAASVAPQLEECKQDKVIILEDYADPFDAKQGPGSQTTAEIVTENDGYMEPYEAQKMMAEIRRRGSKDLPCKPLHLYDTPYEPSENGFESEGEKSSGQRPRESRLPQDDERPPEEYDQPWEWKKERISKAFAVEIKVIKDLPWPPPVGQLNSSTNTQESDVSTSFSQQPPSSPHLTSQNSLEDSNDDDDDDKTGMSPSREEKLRHMHRHSAGNLKAVKNPSLEQISSVGERIDPSLPLESQFWYHGTISRTDAECLLRLSKEASYLVRNSETSKIDFSLSLKSSQGFMHMKLSRTKENQYVLGQNSPPFDSVPEIIHYYTSRKLPIKGAEHMSLLYPVAIRTL
ncbi:SH2 domain-containing adapter protein F isoform X1 [Bufo gargarizans]|uniref:SH2 domain-containing adapter protein F isoform X1 n=1 Tax=Bufo gargarizans TaxID=30331 RepID=UPI001CF42B24|nr:SH2 domain-containing adapter protein F isoform X1 [Bufo gargarizans]